MSEWKGLDPGGTEQLWDATILIDVLRIFKAHEPFSRNSADSPIFTDLEEAYPDITWENVNADGSFRPIFRKTNPWVKLGLITPEADEACLTSIGDELLSGEKSLSEVFIEATKNHIELDGTHSFSVVCKAALELPNETFTLEDIEYGISRGYASGTEPLSSALDHVRLKNISFPSDSRRKRTLRAFMNSLVTSGAIVNATNGWCLNDPNAAAEIADIQDRAKPIVSKLAPSKPAQAATGKSSSIKEIAAGKRALPTFDPSTAVSHDPIQRALLLEKANSIHERLIEKCADCIRSIGKTPVEDQNSFDIAVIADQVLIEVKSIHPQNTISQLRKAIAQLPEYRWRHRNHFIEDSSRLVIVTNDNPAKYVDPEFIQYVIEDRGINLFWQEKDQILNAQGLTLEQFLSLSD